MRNALLLPALFLGVAASAEAPPAVERVPAPTAPLPRSGDALLAPSAAANCRDRIETVRDERALPRLRRDRNAADEPLLIAAVDQRIDGCSVLVMRHDLSDVRPLPEFEDGPATIKPAQ
jgi:hypothetical protein